MNKLKQMSLLKRNDYFIYNYNEKYKKVDPKMYKVIENNIFEYNLLAYSYVDKKNVIINYKEDTNDYVFIFLGKRTKSFWPSTTDKFYDSLYDRVLTTENMFNINKTEVTNIISNLTPEECKLAIENLEYIKILLEKKAFEQI